MLDVTSDRPTQTRGKSGLPPPGIRGVFLEDCSSETEMGGLQTRFYPRKRIQELKFVCVCVCDTSQDTTTTTTTNTTTTTTTTTDLGKITIYQVFIGCTGVPWYLMMILGK